MMSLEEVKAAIARPSMRGQCLRALILLAGIMAPQVVLFGPSLVGSKVLLPLNVLASPGVYLPQTPETQALAPQHLTLSDEVEVFEVFRRFAAGEVRAGRLPLWYPYAYGGVSFATFPTYSLFHIPYYFFPVPLTLAWIQLGKSLIAGLGAYLFFRRVLDVGFWPAAVGAWCYPLTGIFLFWQGFAPSLVVAWLPWHLLVTERAIRRPWGFGGLALALLTCLVLLTGQTDIGGQVLLISGLYTLWKLWDSRRALTVKVAGGAVAATVGGWTLGFLLAAPYLLPMLEYTQTGARIMKRAAGTEERPPVGLAALPLTVLPYLYGSHLPDADYIGPRGNLLESAAVAYTGLLATLVLAPLGWCSLRHRSINVFWALLALVGLGWVLAIPGLVQLFRLPLLNMLSANRFVFAASFAILAMAVVGLEMLPHRESIWRPWFVIPIGLLLVLGGWCLYRCAELPEEVATFPHRVLQLRLPAPMARALAAQGERIQQTFLRSYRESAVLCGLGVGLWLLICSPQRHRPWFGPLVAAALVADLLWFGYDLNPQCDPALYYPPIPVLTQLSQAPAGRVLGVQCLPPNLNGVVGLREVRGYDGVDPLPMVQLLEIARNPRYQSPAYARIQSYVPQMSFSQVSGTIRVPPILSMLNVRYFIFRGVPASFIKPLLSQADYWVVENPDALPRVFIPRRVVSMPDRDRTLACLKAPDFDPRQTAYVEGPVSLPAECRGTATIEDEVPTCVRVAVAMETPGLLLLSDQWDKGWRAYVKDQPVPIVRANYALRGVEVPSGKSWVVFRYEPESLRMGLRLLAVALGILCSWGLCCSWFLRRRRVLQGRVPDADS